MGLSDSKKRKLSSNYVPTKLFLETYNYYEWLENEESTDITTKSYLQSLPSLEGDQEEVKEGTGSGLKKSGKKIKNLGSK